MLSAVYTELRGNIVYAFEDRLFFLTTSFELFIEIYNLLEQEDTGAKRSVLHYTITSLIMRISPLPTAYMIPLIRQEIQPTAYHSFVIKKFCNRYHLSL